MKKGLIIGTIVLIITVAFLYINFFSNATKTKEQFINSNNLNRKTSMNELKITSAAFENNSHIPSRYTCDGADINPPLIISGVPAKTKSLVLVVDDPDAPGGTWTHWTVWNINPETKKISSPSVLAGAVEGITSIGKSGYHGPCPPSGTHRYFFKLYALDTKLNLPASASKPGLLNAMTNHTLAEAQLVGLYSRGK